MIGACPTDPECDSGSVYLFRRDDSATPLDTSDDLWTGAGKLVASDAYPPQLYNLEQDPNELHNRADNPSSVNALEDLRSILAQTWDLDRLRADIIDSQKTRQMLCRALAKGRHRPWEPEPNAPAHMSFIRGDDRFPDVERQRYLPEAD